jgi:hypothetical protein
VEYRKPESAHVERFVNLLRDRQVVTHIRVARGDDVAAACGQLRERNEVDSVETASKYNDPATTRFSAAIKERR